MSTSQYNTRSAGVRRLMQEAKELKEPTQLFHAQPLEENLFEWHFSVRGPADSDFEGGIYHGRLIFPAEYPMKPPNIILLTPNGRFELNKKICLSISGYHPETWLPSWSIRTALLALIGFMPSNAGGAIGGVSYPTKERKMLALRSVHWRCSECGAVMKEVLKPLGEDGQRDECEARSLIKESQAGGDASGEGSTSPSETTVPPSTPTVPPPSSAVLPPTSTVPTSPTVPSSVPIHRVQSSPTQTNSFVIFSLFILCTAIFVSLLYRRFYIVR